MERYAATPTGGISYGANEPLGGLWNVGTTSIPLWVRKVIVIHTASLRLAVARLTLPVSTRGTAQSTVTPTVDNAFNHRVTCPSGALVDRSDYTANPTQLTPAIC